MTKATRHSTGPLLLSAIVGLLLLVSAGPASAHAAYKDSNPPDEGTVSMPPSEVWAEFTEPLIGDSTLQIFDPCGDRVDAGDYQVVLTRITVSMSSDKQGTFTANWAVISDTDGHPTSGTFTFTSTGGAACPGQAEEPADDGERNPQGSDDGPPAKGSNGGSSAGETATVASAGAGSDESAASATKKPGKKGPGKQGPGKPGRHEGSGGKAKNHRQTNDQRTVQLTRSDDVEGGSRSGDIPANWLLISFGIAALIGAAGGQVYSAIVFRR
jgi:methionine-rich copper-binding protein CopC